MDSANKGNGVRGESNSVDAFISRWAPSGGGERSNCQMFLVDLCRLLGVPEPDPAVEDESRNAYVFERKVPARRLDAPTTANFVDLYKRGCFVLEAKQSRKRQKQLEELKQLGRHAGNAFRLRQARRAAMGHAHAQRTRAGGNLRQTSAAQEGWPPFLVIVDVGHVIELWADFSLQGKHYAQFPDRQSYRIYLDDLRDDAVRDRLRQGRRVENKVEDVLRTLVLLGQAEQVENAYFLFE